MDEVAFAGQSDGSLFHEGENRPRCALACFFSVHFKPATLRTPAQIDVTVTSSFFKPYTGQARQTVVMVRARVARLGQVGRDPVSTMRIEDSFEIIKACRKRNHTVGLRWDVDMPNLLHGSSRYHPSRTRGIELHTVRMNHRRQPTNR